MGTSINCNLEDRKRDANDFNQEYMYRCWQEEIEAAGQPQKGAAVKSIAFYGILIIMVTMAFFYSTNSDPGKRFGAFSYNTVLTSSMQSVYPQGSLITSWAIKEGEPLQAGLGNGDDIVFVKEDETVVVHRIIEIMTDYEDTGQRAFKTQGVDNPTPDSWITYEGNVIGKVTWHVPYVGQGLLFISDNIMLVVGAIVAIAVLLALWQAALKKE
jgi:signal peptidase